MMFQKKFLKIVFALAFCFFVKYDAKSDLLSEFSASQKEQTFTGSPITLQLKDADVREVLRMIGDASGFNIIVHPAVQGKISLSLEQVPWDQALDVVLNTMGLGAERNKSVLRVLPREQLIAEKQKELDIKKLSAESTPRITRIFPVSYAELSQLVNVLQSFLTSQSKTPGSSSIPGTIITDQGTNSVIVRDTAENIERVKKMIELLDVQVPQVLIEAKVVEASDNFSRNFGGNIGLSGGKFLIGFNGNDPTASLIGSAASGSTAAAASSGAVGTAGLGASIGYTLPGSSMRLNAAINMSESEDKVKVVSSPKVVVISGKSATINQSSTRNVPVTTNVGGVSTTTFQPISADTRLNVTPRVTNDGSVFLKLDLSRGILRTPSGAGQQPFVEPRNMNTEVIVESGGTIVIGGIYSTDEEEGESGIPILRKIPIIGWLFGNETKTSGRTELMFFVTPRILNPKKVGIQSVDATPPANSEPPPPAEDAPPPPPEG